MTSEANSPAIAAEGLPAQRRGCARWLFTTDHRDIGTLYLVFAIVAGLVGGALSGVMRAELAHPGLQYLPWLARVSGQPADATLALWHALISAHGLIMVFFLVIPAMVGGFGNWFVPLLIGAPDMAFPRMNNLSFWLIVPAFLLLIGSALLPGGDGWTLYAPGRAGPGVDMAILALELAAASTILGAINFIATILNLRAPGMSLHDMPLFVWSLLVTAFLLLLALPVLAAAITLMLRDPAGLPGTGGVAAVYQQLFWFFGHPEVYVMILPGFGMISQIVAAFAGRRLLGQRSVAYAMVAIGLVGFVTWAHQIYAGTPGGDGGTYLATATAVLALPSAVTLICWIATLWGRPLRRDLPMLWSLGFVFMFVVGGLTGVAMAAADTPDADLADSYYVVAHFHYVLSLGAVFALFAGFTYWFPRMSGRQLGRALGLAHFWLFFVGVNLIFFPMHILGLEAMPRRIPDYPQSYAGWNHLSTIGYGVMSAGLLLFFVNIGWSLLAGRPAPADPWGAGTREWQQPDARGSAPMIG